MSRSEQLAILGGLPVRDEDAHPWPQWPERSGVEVDAVAEATRAGDWGGFPFPSPATARFSERFAEMHGAKWGLCVSNGTVALEVALKALAVPPGSEVIVPAYTFEATAAVVLFSGCVPVFADVDPQTYCIDPRSIEERLTERTRAVMPVHLAMCMADMDAISELAERHELVVVEDCAHAHGSQWRERGAGSWGDAGGFSFQTSKLLTAGEGGIVLTSREDVLDAAYSLTNCGRQRPGRASDFEGVGHNYRMTDLQAVLLEHQLDRLLDQQGRRQAQAERVTAALESVAGLEPLRADARQTRQAIYQFVVRYDPEAFGGVHRDRFVAALKAEGVPCDGTFYESLPQSPLLRDQVGRFPQWHGSAPEHECPIARRAAYDESIWLSHHLLLGSEGDTDDLIEAIEKVARLAPDLTELDANVLEGQQLGRLTRES